MSVHLEYQKLFLSFTKINIIHPIRNSLNLTIIINALYKLILRLSTLERICHDYSRSTAISQTMLHIFMNESKNYFDHALLTTPNSHQNNVDAVIQNSSAAAA